jgi:hypothetical protein
MRPTEADRLPETVTELADRRRPGRLNAHPALLPLLRNRATPQPTDTDACATVVEDTQTDGAARGIVVGLLISVPVWAAIILAIRTLL